MTEGVLIVGLTERGRQVAGASSLSTAFSARAQTNRTKRLARSGPSYLLNAGVA